MIAIHLHWGLAPSSGPLRAPPLTCPTLPQADLVQELPSLQKDLFQDKESCFSSEITSGGLPALKIYLIPTLLRAGTTDHVVGLGGTSWDCGSQCRMEKVAAMGWKVQPRLSALTTHWCCDRIGELGALASSIPRGKQSW